MVAFLNEGLPRIEPCFCGRGSKETGNERKVMKIRDFSAFIFPVQDAAVLKATFVCTESSISSLPERPKPISSNSITRCFCQRPQAWID